MANVLIVDDDADTRELTVALVESAGHKVRVGKDGEDGLKSLDSGPYPDCILLDVEMPVLSGPGMAHKMLLHDAGEENIPIILLSGSANLGEIAKKVGTPYFLAKAAEDYSTALLGLLERALRERKVPAPAGGSPPK